MSRRIWSTPEELWSDFEKYADIKAHNMITKLTRQGDAITINMPLPLTIEGFTTYKGINKDSFYAVKDYKDYNDDKTNGINDSKDGKTHNSFSVIIARINAFIEQYVNEQVAIGNFNAQWFQFYSKNKMGYKDVIENVNDNNTTINFNIPRPDTKLIDTTDVLEIISNQ